MNSPTWAQGMVPLLLQALLWTGQGSFFGAWLGYAGCMLALEHASCITQWCLRDSEEGSGESL